MMIRNEREYRITKAAAQKFRAALEHGTQARAPARAKLSKDVMAAQLADLERALREYEDLQSGKGKRHLDGSIENLGALLIKARIARGWTQRELAARLGLQHQKIQQYEITEYESASLTRIRDVARALGLLTEISGKLLELPTTLAAPKMSTTAEK